MKTKLNVGGWGMRFNQSRWIDFFVTKAKLGGDEKFIISHSVVTSPNAEYRWLHETFFYNFSLRLHFPPYHLVCCEDNWQENQIKEKFCVLSNAPGNFARVKKVDKRTDKIIFMWFPRGMERKVIENICLSHKNFVFDYRFSFFYHVFIGKWGGKLVSDSRVLLILHCFRL
jgi:hypothetical protein